ncbi:MAG: GNAT family N-acetyltransferase [Clostridia bacterium]|nr:GNAT family N-acetyltransferase [Clostridia bacterium]
MNDGNTNRNTFTYTYSIECKDGSDTKRVLNIKSTPALFSPKDVDRGTAAMLDACEISGEDVVLDLGCGTGVVGLTAAVRGAQVVMTDVDPQAVETARENAERNLTEEELSRTQATVSDGFDAIERKDFSKILSNPPYHTDFAVAKKFIEGAFAHLRIGGQLFMVTKRLEWYKNKLTAVFGGVRVKEAEGGYFVFESCKRGGTPYNVNKEHSRIVYRVLAEDADPAPQLEFVKNVFDWSLAPHYSDEGKATFAGFLESARIFPTFRYIEAVDDVRGRTVGVLAVNNEKTHISLLFVDEKYRRKGIATRLVEMAASMSEAGGLTVNAEPTALDFYLKAGFKLVDPGPDGRGVVNEKDGIRTVRLFLKIRRDRGNKKPAGSSPAGSADDRT